MRLLTDANVNLTLNGLSKIRKTWTLYTRNGATLVHGLYVVLQFSFTEVNGAELQYTTYNLWTGSLVLKVAMSFLSRTTT